MSLANSRSVTPGPLSSLKCEGEANVGEDATCDTVSFIEPTIVFQVQNALFGVPRSQVLKSGFFRGMMESPHLGDSKEGSAEHPIIFDERTKITRSDMKNFCAVLDIRACESPPRFSVAEWASAYRLAKMWEFEQLRDYIFKHINTSITDPFDRIEYADALGFSQWIAPAFVSLCTRDAALTATEGERLGFVRFAELCRVREQGRPRHNANQYDGLLNKTIISTKYHPGGS